MRYSVYKFINEKLKRKSKIAISFLILMPIAAIICGKLLTKFLILPYFNNTKISKTTVSYKSIDKFNFYILQAGIFNSKVNASTLCSGIEGCGYNCAVVEDNSAYRVIVNISDNVKDAELIMDKLKKSGYNSIIKSYEISFIYDSKLEKMKSYTAAVSSMLEGQSEMLNSNIKLNENTKIIESSINAVKEEYKNVDTAFNKDLDTRFKAFNSIMMKNAENFIADSKSSSNQKCFKDLAEETIILKNFNEYICQVKIN
jgi:hypothetical protein